MIEAQERHEKSDNIFEYFPLPPTNNPNIISWWSCPSPDIHPRQMLVRLYQDWVYKTCNLVHNYWLNIMCLGGVKMNLNPLFTSHMSFVYTGWTKKNWDLKKYVYCSEGHKNEANQILILCMFSSTLGHWFNGITIDFSFKIEWVREIWNFLRSHFFLTHPVCSKMLRNWQFTTYM